MVRILIAPNAYKGTYSPDAIAKAMKTAVQAVSDETGIEFETTCAPLADGGDGTIEALHLGAGGTVHRKSVRGAVGEARLASWLDLDKTAVVELASACGIAGLEHSLAPLKASTHGLGEVILEVCSSGKFEDIIIAVGGSASTDGGSGALEALGARFFNTSDEPIAVKGGGSLGELSRCDLGHLDAIRKTAHFRIATDVASPLCGINGAAYIFGPQKGASESEVQFLDASLAHYADILESFAGKCDRNTAGAGAAGGTAFGLSIGLNAPIVPGFALIAELIGLEQKLNAADIVITGEGRIDESTMHGKTVAQLWAHCQSANKSLLVIAGTVAPSLKLGAANLHVCAGAEQGQRADLTDITRATKRLLAEVLRQHS